MDGGSKAPAPGDPRVAPGDSSEHTAGGDRVSSWVTVDASAWRSRDRR
jgi:hypothetical protein